ncbi:MAG: serine/threonine-protein kinase, partial [Planctomycetota bacterium]
MDSTNATNNLESIVGNYLAAADAKGFEYRLEIRQQALLQHPQFSDELKLFFDQEDAMEDLGNDLKGNSEPGDAAEDHRGRGNAAVVAGQTGDGSVLQYLGSFALLQKIGQGGMGQVYKARQLTTGRTVAVKLMRYTAPLKRFQREIELVASLKHVNIVEIYEANSQDGRQFFAMEFVDGGSLEELEGADCKCIAAAIRDVANGLEAAHQSGVLHRDIKPSNILIDSEGVPKLADFGLAKQIDSSRATQTASGEALGTFDFMPPEQASGRLVDVTAASDVYALGATLYQTLTGQPVFQSENLQQLLAMIFNEEPQSPRKWRSEIPVDLERICLKCLNKAPSDRYDSAADLSEDLSRFLSGFPISARPLLPHQRVLRWAAREPVLACLIAALIAVMSAGLLISNHYRVQSDKDAKEATRNSERADSRARRENQIAADIATSNNTLRRRLYAADMRQLQHDLFSGESMTFRTVKTKKTDSIRSWEYDRFRYLSAKEDNRFELKEFGSFNAIAIQEEVDVKGRVGHALQETAAATLRGSVGKLLCLCGDDRGWVRLLNLRQHADGKRSLHRLREFQFGSHPIHLLKFSPDGQAFAVADKAGGIGWFHVSESTQKETATRWELNSKAVAISIAPDQLEGTGQEPYLIAASSTDGTVHVWRNDQTEEIQIIHPESQVTSLAIQFVDKPDADMVLHARPTSTDPIVSAGTIEGSLLFWSSREESPAVESIPMHRAAVADLSFS